MRIVIKENGHSRIFAATNLNPSTPLSELLKAMQLDLRNWADTAWVDDKATPLNQTCAEAAIADGSEISNTAPATGNTKWQIAYVGGPNSGQITPLPNGHTIRLGRSPESEVHIDSASASWSHALLNVQNEEVWIKDDNSTNGTYLNGRKLQKEAQKLNHEDILTLGGVTLQIQHNPPQTEKTNPKIGPTGHISFNRPPRPGLPPKPKAITAPTKKDVQKANKFSWLLIASPLVMAVAMMLIMGSIRYAMIALLTPVIAVATWFEQRRNAKGNQKEADEKYQADLEKLEVEILAATNQERTRLRAIGPYPHLLFATAKTGQSNLWQVRSGDEDYWNACLGTSNLNYEVPIVSNTNKLEERARKAIDTARLPVSPVNVDLVAGPVGIWGQREHALAIARSLVCQIATHTGPADMSIVVLGEQRKENQWKWANWLPHTQTPSTDTTDRYIAHDTEQAATLARTLLESLAGTGPKSLFVIVDNTSVLQGRESAARDLLAYKPLNRLNETPPRVTGIVIASSKDELPASCHTVIEAQDDSEATVLIPSELKEIKQVSTTGIKAETANEWSRYLAKFDDPEISNRSGALPALVHLFDLLELDRETLSSNDIELLWKQKTPLNAPLGIGVSGTFWYDIVKDGPHGLVGGTTGSGKSELLRSLIAGLAARLSPEEINFILVDFKGGAAFSTLDKLPHTIGTLSNLEQSLAYRALKALEAEIRYRQARFAQAGEGIDSLKAYQATNPTEPMPRILVVIDEFAQLAKTYPDVLASLVSIGAVGRTLGIHMILATQRPEGSVNEEILANTNMRVALRVQSKQDSINVISVPNASAIGRNQQGRAYVKLGEEDINPIQTALVTGVSGRTDTEDLYVQEILLGQKPAVQETKRKTDEVADMDLLIQAIVGANEKCGYAKPRPVWPAPLGEDVELPLPELKQSAPAPGHVTATPTPETATPGQTTQQPPQDPSYLKIALIDDPARQSQYATGWNLKEGNLLLIGIAGSGTTTALKSLAYRVAASRSPETTDILSIDFDTMGLDDLVKLPHSKGHVTGGSANRELQHRFLRVITAEYDKRTSHPGKYNDLFIFIDGFTTMREAFTAVEHEMLLKEFYQLWAKGPAVGIYCVVATARNRAIPSDMGDVITQKWVFQLSDPYDYSILGVKKENIPATLPGRFVDLTCGLHAQVARVRDEENTLSLIARRWGQIQKPTIVQPLPNRVLSHQLAGATSVQGPQWRIPVGIAESDLSVALMDVWAGEGFMILGPARSGKSSVLLGIAHKVMLDLQAAGQSVTVVGAGSKRSPLLAASFGTFFEHEDLPTALQMATLAKEPTILLLDDIHLITDSDGGILNLLKQANPNVLVLLAGRSDEIRTQYGKWTQTVARDRLGMLLQPNFDTDGTLLGVSLSRRQPVALSEGRGFACSAGLTSLVQAVTYKEAQ